MIHVFHILTVLVIIYEWSWMYSPVEKTKDSEQYLKLNKEFKGKELDEYSKEYKDLLWKKSLPALVIVVWILFGLMTFNWVVFSALIILNFAIVAPLSKLTRFSVMYIVIHWINSLIGFIAAMFIIINQYHLNIDLFQLISQW